MACSGLKMGVYDCISYSMRSGHKGGPSVKEKRVIPHPCDHMDAHEGSELYGGP